MRELSRRQKWKKARVRRLRAMIYIFTLIVATLATCSWYFLYKASAETDTPVKQELQPKPKEMTPKSHPKKSYSPLSENERKQQQIDDYLKEKNFNGTVYIENKGKYLFQKGFGYADFSKLRENDRNTIYCIGSAQKAIIATAVLQLQEKGLLSVKDPLSKYLPHFPNGNKIKIENLLSHTSGLKPRKNFNRYMTPKQIIFSIEKTGVKRNPGKWEYHDENYAVAAYLVQQISGVPLDIYIQKNIFEKAGMTDAGFGESFKKEADHACSYQIKEGKIVPFPITKDMSQFFGAGDMYLSTKSAALFDNALANGTLINHESYKRMLRKGPGKYGFGFYDYGSYHIARGVFYGYETSNAFSKDHKLTIILFGNARTPAYNNYKLTKDILKIVKS